MWNRSSSISRSSKGALGVIYNHTGRLPITQFSKPPHSTKNKATCSIRPFSIIRNGRKNSTMVQDKAALASPAIASPETQNQHNHNHSLQNHANPQLNHHSRNIHMNHGNHKWASSLATHTLTNGESTHKPASKVSYCGQSHAELMDTTLSLDVRNSLGLRGVMPPAVDSHDIQIERCLARIRAKTSNLDKYEYLANLRYTNVHLFYKVLMAHIQFINPYVYTPVVGEACQRFSHIYVNPEGLHISLKDKGHIYEILERYPVEDLEITVVTDGSRILGLGDLGLNGMGIPIGKLSLYVACAGIHPHRTLPITLDYGTNNEEYLNDPLYMGLRQKRISNKEAKEFIAEFMEAIRRRWPKILVQFEDFNTELAFELLDLYRDKQTCFNDDIQGTASVVLSGFVNAIRRSGLKPHDHRLVFFGAGSAGVGVATMLKDYLVHAGLTEEEAVKTFYLVDSKGLVATNRGDKLPVHKISLARTDPATPRLKSLEEVIDWVKPTGLLGLSTTGGTFTESIIKKMAKFNKAPIVFPLSNPSEKSECNFEQALTWTEGRVLFASGSPFADHIYEGKTYTPGQGNNMYIFPGLGLGTILSHATKVTDAMILSASEALASCVTEEEFSRGLLYPDISRIRAVSLIIARDVIRTAQKQKVDMATELRSLSDKELEAYIKRKTYSPEDLRDRLEAEYSKL